MPRIPIYTSQTQAFTPNYNTSVHAPLEDDGSVALSKSLSNAASVLTESLVQAKLQQQDMEFVQKHSEFNAGVEDIKLSLSRDERIRNNPDLYYDEYIKRVNELDRNIGKSIISGPGTQRAFSAYVTKQIPGLAVNGRAQQLALLDDKNYADLLVRGESLSSAAAKGTPEERTAAIEVYEDLVDRAWERGNKNIDTAAKRETMIAKFKRDVFTKNMNALAITDPKQLLKNEQDGLYADVDAMTRATAFARAQSIQASQDAKTAAVMRDTEEFVWNWAAVEASNGRLPQTYIDQIRNGKNPFIRDPTKAAALEKMQDESGGSLGVKAIMQGFYSSPDGFTDPKNVLRRTKEARERLLQYQNEGGNTGKAFTDAMKELKGIETQFGAEQRALESQGRARETQARTTLHEDMRRAEEMYDAQVKQLSPVMKRLFPNMRAQDIGNIYIRIRSGAKPEDAVKQVLDSKTRKQPNPELDDLDKVLGGRRR